MCATPAGQAVTEAEAEALIEKEAGLVGENCNLDYRITTDRLLFVWFGSRSPTGRDGIPKNSPSRKRDGTQPKEE